MVVKLNLTVDGTSLEGLQEGAKHIVRHVRPEWNEADLQFKLYSEGITNQLIGVWSDDRDKQLLVRVYGSMTEMFIDRDKERRNIEILHKAGCGPQLYATFDNGLSYGFTKGVPLSTDLNYEERVWKAVSREMAIYHKIEEEDKEDPMLFPKLRHFLSLLPTKFKDAEKQKRIDECGYSKVLISQETDEMESYVTCLNCPVVFSHNDILLGNIIWNETTQKVNFIDYEYGGTNYQPYDIANHFNEFAGVDDVDYSRYPGADFQRRWLRNYHSHYQGIPAEQVKDDEVEAWYIWVNKFALCSHLFWGAWAMVQAHYSSIDFDYLGYGITRIDEYFKRKEEFLNLKPNLQ